MHGYYYYCTQSEFCIDPIALGEVKTRMDSQVFYCFVFAEAVTVGSRYAFVLVGCSMENLENGMTMRLSFIR